MEQWLYLEHKIKLCLLATTNLPGTKWRHSSSITLQCLLTLLVSPVCLTHDRQKGSATQLLLRWNTSTHLVSSACCSKHARVFTFYSLEGFWSLQVHSAVISLTSATKGLITTVPKCRNKWLQHIPSPQDALELSRAHWGSFSAAGRSRSFSTFLWAAPAQQKWGSQKKTGTGLMMGHCSWEAERSRGGTEPRVPLGERVIKRFLPARGQELPYPEQPLSVISACLAMAGWHFTNETESSGAEEWLCWNRKKPKPGIFKILYALN